MVARNTVVILNRMVPSFNMRNFNLCNLHCANYPVWSHECWVCRTGSMNLAAMTLRRLTSRPTLLSQFFLISNFCLALFAGGALGSCYILGLPCDVNFFTEQLKTDSTNFENICNWQDYYRAYKRIAEIRALKEAEYCLHATSV